MEIREGVMKSGDYPYLFVELVGLAGAGKSTLAAALVEQVEQVESSYPPDLHSLGTIPFFLWNTLLMLPTFFLIMRETQWKLLSRHEMAILVILNGWGSLLTSRSLQGRTLLVDQGPISFLAMVERMNSPWRSSPTGKKWLQKIYKQWSRLIDIVVMLDASNEVLVDRIRTRSQVHNLQKATFEEASDVLGLYREIYPRVVECLKSHNPTLKVLSYITTSGGKEVLHTQVADDLRNEITQIATGSGTKK